MLPAASVHNPVDLVAQASVPHYEASLEALLESPEVDQVVVLFIPPVVTRGEEVAQAIRGPGKRWWSGGKTASSASPWRRA